jgi:uncharacterized protein
MSKHVPDFINPRRAAEGGYDVAGTVAFTRMARLSKAVENHDGAAEVALHFALDEQGIPVVKGRVRSEAVLICQRCLSPLSVPIDLEVELGIVASDEEAKRLPTHYDPLVAGEDRLAVAELVEDEILLALPAIPRHEDAACTAGVTEAPAEQASGRTDNPFAVLEQLKSKR